MIDALSLTIFNDNVLSNFTGIILEITETPIVPTVDIGSLYDIGYSPRPRDKRVEKEKEEKKYKRVSVRFSYEDKEYIVEKIIEDNIKVTAENIEISVVENKHILNIWAEIIK